MTSFSRMRATARSAVVAELTLPHIREVNLDVEHIGIGDQPHVPSGTCARQIAVRSLDRTLTRAGRRLELQDANKRTRRREREILPRASAGCGRQIAPDLGALDAEFGEPRVEHGLLHRHGGARVGHRRGMIERIDREVRGREASLRQQRAEDEDRLIPALDAFGDIDTRKEAGARLRGHARLPRCRRPPAHAPRRSRSAHAAWLRRA